MSEQTPEPPTPPEGSEAEVKTFDAEYVDKLRKEAAKYRTEAKTNAEAAKRLAEMEDAQKSEAEKAAERIRHLETEAAEAQRRALRAEIAGEKGLSPSQAKRLVGNTREELEADADELLKDIGMVKKQGNVVAREGHTSRPAESEELAVARSLFGTPT